jgi:formate dehydrogenase maturation protein FdhE
VPSITAGTWDRRIDRAETLAAGDEATRPLLTMYAGLLRLQRQIADNLAGFAQRSCGVLDRDLPILRACLRPVLQEFVSTGFPTVTAEAAAVLGRDPAFDELLQARDGEGTPPSLLARIVLQPYAEGLAAAGMRPLDLGVSSTVPERCPVCGAAPQLSVLHERTDSDGSGRHLVCSICSTAWPFRRIRCAACGEEDERRLAYFHSESVPHIRVDACDACGRYLKTVDLTRLGTAVPVVDEVAGASLDLWARDQGYEKVVLNLVGL